MCLGLVEGVIGKIQLHTGKWKYSCQCFHLCAPTDLPDHPVLSYFLLTRQGAKVGVVKKSVR